ncbi:MAG TPA: alpha/beta fold hydrolase [Pyrinomonadaceae bacterium]|nr:alpha/beta fold hydrolase [Pyrinomonadaceae bacterium]
MKLLGTIFFLAVLPTLAWGQDTITLHDLAWDKASPAGTVELTIPSEGSLLQGFLYRANGKQKHPTLLLLHGYPGNERNLDLAQMVRAQGWNVIYFDYRGSWGSQGKFSFENSVQDVVNVVAFCEKNQDKYQIDPSNIVLFGHSMGGWVCLKALQKLPTVRKGFALSTWNIYSDFKDVKTRDQLIAMVKDPKAGVQYMVLNTPVEDIFLPVLDKPYYYDVTNDAVALAGKQIIMLDEHSDNKGLAEAIRGANKTFFDYQVWPTDHGFTNKRVSLMNLVLSFLKR